MKYHAVARLKNVPSLSLKDEAYLQLNFSRSANQYLFCSGFMDKVLSINGHHSYLLILPLIKYILWKGSALKQGTYKGAFPAYNDPAQWQKNWFPNCSFNAFAFILGWHVEGKFFLAKVSAFVSSWLVLATLDYHFDKMISLSLARNEMLQFIRAVFSFVVEKAINLCIPCRKNCDLFISIIFFVHSVWYDWFFMPYITSLIHEDKFWLTASGL